MKKKTDYDQKAAIISILACILAIVIFHFAWGGQVFKHSTAFYVVDTVLLGAVGWRAIIVAKTWELPEITGNIWTLVGFTLICCAWAGGWNADAMTWAEQFKPLQ